MAYKKKVIKPKRRFRNLLVYTIFALGVVILCGFLAAIQTLSAETNQTKSSKIILNEVTETLHNNDQIIDNVFFKFDSINQTTLNTLSSYIEYTDVLSPVVNAGSQAEQIAAIGDAVSDLKDLCDELSVNGIVIFDQTGLVVLGSDQTYLQKNITNELGPDSLSQIVGHTVVDNVVTRNGTYSLVDGKEVYNPIRTNFENETVYLYSSYFTSRVIDNVNNDYYLLTYVPSTIIDEELKGIKSIESVLSGFTVGKTGFVFAVDGENKTFDYFNDGKTDLTNENISEYGLKDKALNNDYRGYQTINGISYYCVSKTFASNTYGEFTVIAAVVTANELLAKNTVSIVCASVAFLLVAGIVTGYGLILRRDIADHLISLEDKHRSNLKEDTSANQIKLTEEEIDERTKIIIEDVIEKNEDKKLSRVLIGVRNKKGVQRYFSKFIFYRMLSVIVIGLAAIFLISYFSQTLLGLNDATSISKYSLDEVVNIIENNKNNTDSIRKYVDEQFVSKSKLFSNLLQETPEVLFDSQYTAEDNFHLVYDYDSDGNVVYLDYVDYPGVARKALSNSLPLQEICDKNGVDAIYLYSDDGKVLATNTTEWYKKVSKDANDSTYHFNDILLDKKDEYIADELEVIDEDHALKHIASEFFYYTKLDGDKVEYVSKKSYDKCEADKVTYPVNPIKKHRSLIEIIVNQKSLAHLFETSTMEYVLGNMHVYGENSFFIAFDNSEDHLVVYSPLESSIGKTAASIGMKEAAFPLAGVYNGFQKVNGVEYYQSIRLVGEYYIATAIPTSDVYQSRNSIALYSLLLSALFIIIASGMFTLSSDRDDKEYCDRIKFNRKEDQNNSFTIKTPSGKVKRTTSISSRFSKVKWAKKSPEEKLSTILMGYLTFASILIVVALVIAINSQNQDTIFAYILSGVWEKGLNVFAFTEALMIMVVIITITKLTQIIVKSFCGNLGARVETTGNLVVSVLKYGGVIGGLFYCLYLFGFNTASLLTSAGILSIVVGLGAQSLISDIIAGIFIVFEGAFRVGDIVTIGDFRGQVTEIGLRTTKIEDISKNIKIFNNSAISGVLNMTKESSIAVCTIGIEYGTSLEKVESVLKNAFPKIRRKIPEIIDGPYYKGVSELAESSVNILIVAHCEEKDRIQLHRDLNREIFLLFKENNINIPFPQVTLSNLKEEEPVITKKDKKEAALFIEEQKEVSGDLVAEDEQ